MIGAPPFYAERLGPGFVDHAELIGAKPGARRAGSAWARPGRLARRAGTAAKAVSLRERA